MIDKNNLIDFKQKLLKDLNVRAALIIRAEEQLRKNKVSINKEILYGLPDAKLIELVEAWDPKTQEHLRNKVRIETGPESDHTTNGSGARGKVSQLTFYDMQALMRTKLEEIAMDYQFDKNSPDYLGFLNCCPREEWSYNELYTLSIFLGRERSIFDLMLRDVSLDIEAGADLDEIIFIER